MELRISVICCALYIDYALVGRMGPQSAGSMSLVPADTHNMGIIDAVPSQHILTPVPRPTVCCENAADNKPRRVSAAPQRQGQLLAVAGDMWLLFMRLRMSMLASSRCPSPCFTLLFPYFSVS
jgi:hypothetical protein